MPKLLRKDILASNVISFVIAFVIGMIMLIFDDETPKSLFYAYNIMISDIHFFVHQHQDIFLCVTGLHIYSAIFKRAEEKAASKKDNL